VFGLLPRTVFAHVATVRSLAGKWDLAADEGQPLAGAQRAPITARSSNPLITNEGGRPVTNPEYVLDAAGVPRAE